MSVITEAVQTWKSRLREIEQQIAPLVQEADELRKAITSVGDVESSRPAERAAARPARQPRRAAAGDGSASAQRGRRTATGRAPRGQNRQLILQSIQSEAKTAGQVAQETGIGRGTVATTLTKLVNDGSAVKAERGYKAACRNGNRPRATLAAG
jgi:predicted Rossmann fold nucleotide-binding protein DprA/Smf involved in DNA uptake